MAGRTRPIRTLAVSPIYTNTLTKCPECGSCHIYVKEGRKSLSKTRRAENEKLDSIVGVSSSSRLACQATIGSENVTGIAGFCLRRQHFWNTSGAIVLRGLKLLILYKCGMRRHGLRAMPWQCKAIGRVVYRLNIDHRHK
nr:2Fe-2S iron-sulfur cluster-binding protein [Sulfuriferula plumbiphila]